MPWLEWLKGTARLSVLVSEILDVARIDQGVFQLDRRPIELSTLVQDVVKGLLTPEHSILLKVSEHPFECGEALGPRQGSALHALAALLRYVVSFL